VNSPLQGTAADLIKTGDGDASNAALDTGGYRSAMLVQVHDELGVRVPAGGACAGLETGEARNWKGPAN